MVSEILTINPRKGIHMKAAFFRKTGGPDVIEYGDLPTPDIKDDEALVKVSAVAVNPVDTYIRSGKYLLNPPLPNPYIIGLDFVGVISKVGKKVKNFKLGQRVWCNSMGLDGRQGSFSEFVAVDQEHLYPAPDNANDLQIVSVINSGAAACIGLIRIALLRASEIIFVNGGAGNVGSAVIQLAVARGARVIASTSGAEKIQWCKSLGAELVLDYKKDDFAKAVNSFSSHGVDVFWDTSRNPNFEVSVPLLAPKGRIVLMSGSDAHPSFPVGMFYNKECTLKGFSMLHSTALELRGCAEIINLCLIENKLKSKISHEMKLEDASKAHAFLESMPDLWGKIVLRT